MKSARVDAKRRLVLPPKFPPHSAVTIQELDDSTLLIQKLAPARDYKMVLIPAIKRLPDDPEWEKVEQAFTRHSSRTVSELKE
jgi:hypothetical protein